MSQWNYSITKANSGLETVITLCVPFVAIVVSITIHRLESFVDRESEANLSFASSAALTLATIVIITTDHFLIGHTKLVVLYVCGFWFSDPIHLRHVVWMLLLHDSRSCCHLPCFSDMFLLFAARPLCHYGREKKTTIIIILVELTVLSTWQNLAQNH